MADLPGLTGARGILALTVLFFHPGYAPGGWLAVDGFFVLSGIVLTHVYGGQCDFRFTAVLGISCGFVSRWTLRDSIIGRHHRADDRGVGSFLRARFATLRPKR